MGISASHTPEEVEAEKRKFLEMTEADKQAFYVGFAAISTKFVLPWSKYCAKNLTGKDRVPDKYYRYPPDSTLNRKVSLWHGDITVLEVDAVVNSAAPPGKGGQVNEMLIKRAGEYFLDECITKGLPEPGQASTVGGYQLPASYVINTVAPPKRDTETLSNCYRNSLEEAKMIGIRTLVFPCIATRKKNAFDSEKAAKLALTAVRDWLQNNKLSVERVIFCVYEKKDLRIYERVMQEFFPPALEDLTSDDHGKRSTMYPEDEEAVASTALHRHTTLGAGAVSPDDYPDCEFDDHRDSDTPDWSRHNFRSLGPATADRSGRTDFSY